MVKIDDWAVLAPRVLGGKMFATGGCFQGEKRNFISAKEEPIPPGIAGELSRRVEKPVRNGEPQPERAAFATIPARHVTRFGGSNGTVRFGDEGIDYLTDTAGGARSLGGCPILKQGDHHLSP